MSSNATETVIRARELMDSGVDPIVLMSQMATLIVDIIAGTYPNVDGKPDSLFGGRNCKCHSVLWASLEREVVSVEPERSASPSKSFSRVAHRNSTSKDNPVQQTEASSFNPTNQSQFINSNAPTASQGDGNGGRAALRCVNSKMLSNIWLQCIEKCHSKTLRQLLHTHGRLVSICEAKGGFVAHVAFGDRNIKHAQRVFSVASLTHSKWFYNGTWMLR
ncbi:UNVERIFIED_CONTAM: protein STICHEL [Sesamum radiatum]|uniref:Protein STICHEL n=1 Tax=Sesamum radiatum TaxID=300843 RepID=A0AAW2U798_SESRA